MERIIECVPNFSEGRDTKVIGAITDRIEAVDHVALLDVDPGAATHRTVVTFAGEPEAVVEAAVRAAEAAIELIDMRRHHGEHPRFGALDVCPLVPIAGVSMDESVEYARHLAERLGNELGLTVFCYEHAALREENRNLAHVRSGEYEGLAEKLASPGGRPDFGPAEFNPRSGATAVGARGVLVAYNVNLNTTSTRRANAVAFDVREKGRIKREGNPLTGEIVRDEAGDPVYIPGSLEAVKAIGWYIEEYGVAQISMNLTDLEKTPVHVAFDETCKRAGERGMRVTGSELVGLIPLQALVDAGEHYLRLQNRSLGVPESELIKIAVRSLGLDDLKPFDPNEKIIEYKLSAMMPQTPRLVQMPVEDFVQETASESVAPGGGSVSAAVGALGAALATMVANLSSHKRGWDDRWKEFSDWAVKGRASYERLLDLVDRDTQAFNEIMAAYRLPEKTTTDRSAKQAAVQAAAKKAMEVPLEVMEAALDSMVVIKAMAEIGNPASVSDAGVGALCARAAIRGGYLNVRINSDQLDDVEKARRMVDRGAEIESEAESVEREILAIVEERF